MSEQAAEVLNQDGPGTQVNAEESTSAETGNVGETAGEQATANDGDTEANRDEHKRKGGWQRKIEKLERENEVLRDLAFSPKKPEPAKEEARATEDKEPSIDDFTDYNDYHKAVARHEARQEWKRLESEKLASVEKAKVEAEQKTAKEKWDEACDKARKTHDDFDDVAFNPEIQKHITPVMATAVAESELNTELAYYLGLHTDELQRISKLSPVGQAREIGKLESRIAGDTTVEKEEDAPPKTSTAPKPPSPVSRPGAVKVADVYDEKLPYKDWLKARNAQLQRKT